MRIINDTNNSTEYIVTPSGSPLNKSTILASGFVFANTARVIEVKSERPFNVYVKPYSDPANEGFPFRQVSNDGATVRVTIDEE